MLCRTKKILKIFVLFFVAAMLSSCVKKDNARGYYFDENADLEIKPGMDVGEVIYKMGSPTTSAAFGKPAFFYVNAKYEQRIFFSPELHEQKILAIYFSQDGKVEKVKKYDLSDARSIEFSKDRIEIEGNEMGILEQIMGNIGRFSNAGSRKPGV